MYSVNEPTIMLTFLDSFLLSFCSLSNKEEQCSFASKPEPSGAGVSLAILMSYTSYEVCTATLVMVTYGHSISQLHGVGVNDSSSAGQLYSYGG